MKLQFVLNRNIKDNKLAQQYGLIANPFAFRERTLGKQEAWQSLAAGVDEKWLIEMVLRAGMSREVADLLVAHTQNGKKYDVIVDSDTMDLAISEVTDA